MLSIRLYSVMLLLLASMKANSDPQEVIFTRAFADKDYGHYHVSILKRILELTPEYGNAIALPHPHPMPQARQILKLQNGEAHIMWSATSDQREQQLLPVRFPLLQGLAGYRVLVINASRQDQFPATMTFEALQGYVGVQGDDWPDLKVLQHSGLKVEGAPWSLWFTTMFTSVDKGLVDYFPRNVIEVFNDLERHQQKHIALEQNWLIRYPSYEYFFVSPKYPALVARLYEGLYIMLKNGELQQYFEKQPGYQSAMTLATATDRQHFELDNPNLTVTFEQPLWTVDPRPMETYLQRQQDLRTP
ncbi:hypothetical protein [Alteromonas gilva]|uniref:Solute-binding protein family 3/N-terminal domain-containing protein n=1 Tax=Alteromonas gilva TaxID=2987522 RepID=A0ABT5KZ56_9ALTE|nr:hypothetical protein [Alteromonas gilva]MDC8830045.1 hypothetical protein [Alteromonas gilva]